MFNLFIRYFFFKLFSYFISTKIEIKSILVEAYEKKKKMQNKHEK